MGHNYIISDGSRNRGAHQDCGERLLWFAADLCEEAAGPRDTRSFLDHPMLRSKMGSFPHTGKVEVVLWGYVGDHSTEQSCYVMNLSTGRQTDSVMFCE